MYSIVGHRKPLRFSQGRMSLSTEMVRAILAGDKTQTRRVINPLPHPVFTVCNFSDGLVAIFSAPNVRGLQGISCPYEVGDHLWVRESYLPDPPMDDTWDYYMFNDGSGRYNWDALPKRFKKPQHCIYKAGWAGPDLKWKPSIFMPRWASRLTLEVTKVRVERVQDISPQDALAEGVEDDIALITSDTSEAHLREVCSKIAVERFQELWDKINKKRGFGWEKNPWAWALTFKIV